MRGVRPWEAVDAAVRFETPAGRQGQVDFGTFTLPWGRRHALVVVLSHSRLLWLCFYRRQTMAVLMDGLERAFARFGGVPAELLFDQMRAVVLSDDRRGGGELVLNAEFLRFAAHWGFAIADEGGPFCGACQDPRGVEYPMADEAADVVLYFRIVLRTGQAVEHRRAISPCGAMDQ